MSQIEAAPQHPPPPILSLRHSCTRTYTHARLCAFGQDTGQTGRHDFPGSILVVGRHGFLWFAGGNLLLIDILFWKYAPYFRYSRSQGGHAGHRPAINNCLKGGERPPRGRRSRQVTASHGRTRQSQPRTPATAITAPLKRAITICRSGGERPRVISAHASHGRSQLKVTAAHAGCGRSQPLSRTEPSRLPPPPR